MKTTVFLLATSFTVANLVSPSAFALGPQQYVLTLNGPSQSVDVHNQTDYSSFKFSFDVLNGAFLAVDGNGFGYLAAHRISIDPSSSGIFDGEVSINADLANAGTVSIGPAGYVTASSGIENSGVITNQGTISTQNFINSGVYNNLGSAATTNIYGTSQNDGSLVNSAGASVNLVGNASVTQTTTTLIPTVLTDTGSITNNGTMSLGAGTYQPAVLTLYGSIFNGGVLNVSTGSSITLNSGSVTQINGGQIANATGAFTNQQGGVLRLTNANFYGVGGFSNSGTINIDASNSANGNAALTIYTPLNAQGGFNDGAIANLQRCSTATGTCALSGGTWNLVGAQDLTPDGTRYSGAQASLILGITNTQGTRGALNPGPVNSYVAHYISAIDAGTTVSLSGNAVFQQLSSTLAVNQGTLSVDHGPFLINGIVNTGSLVNGPDSAAWQAMSFAGQTINQGTITNSGNLNLLTGSTIIGVGSLTQNGGKITVGSGASISQAAVTVNGGSIGGSGTITVNSGSGTVNVYAGGKIAPGDPQTLTINGNLNLAGGTLELQIGGAGAGQYDVLNVTGQANVTGGTLLLDFINGYAPAAGDSVLQLFAAAGGFTGLSNLTVETEGLGSGFQYQLEGEKAGSLSLLAVNDAMPAAAPVPLPAAAWLMLSGLGGLGTFARKKRAA